MAGAYAALLQGSPASLAAPACLADRDRARQKMRWLGALLLLAALLTGILIANERASEWGGQQS